jgi:RNA-directed DNA polymerase
MKVCGVVVAKLHQWANGDPDRRFDDLFNLVYDPAFLVVAWSRVRGNKGGRTAGVDGIVPRSIVTDAGEFLGELRGNLKARRFTPSRAREKTVPKASGKLRRLGIPTAADRTVQTLLKLVLEPIFEADFKPCSYGFRPKRRAQDAIAEIHFFGSRTYEWVFEADIAACFDKIDHTALMGRVRHRIGDRRILNLMKAFLKAGILSEDGVSRKTITGTPQGGVLSPLLANIALSVLDEHFTRKWEALGPAWTRAKLRRSGVPSMRIVRYADDFVVMIAGARGDAEALWGEVTAVLAPMGMRLSEEKTRACHIDEDFDFLGWHIQRRSRRGQAGKKAIYTYPSKKSLIFCDGQGSIAHRANKAPNTCRPADLGQPSSAGLVQLLPSRRVVKDLRIPRSLHVVEDLRMASETTRWVEQEYPCSPLSSWLEDS